MCSAGSSTVSYIAQVMRLHGGEGLTSIRCQSRLGCGNKHEHMAARQVTAFSPPG